MEDESAQQQNLDQDAHNDWLMKLSDEKLKLLAKELNSLMDSKQPVSSPQKSVTESSSPEQLSAIERAVKRHAGLTPEKAQEVADAFGF
jgi:preprotein translocase subunit SecA